MQEIALFLSAFLAATILPFSSEVAFIAAISNDMPLINALFFASSGNILAIVVNFWFGYWLYEKSKKKLESSNVGRWSLAKGEKYGYVMLLFTWLPIVGDPLTIVAGVLRINFFVFVIVAALLRFGRYYFLSLML